MVSVTHIEEHELFCGSTIAASLITIPGEPMERDGPVHFDKHGPNARK